MRISRRLFLGGMAVAGTSFSAQGINIQIAPAGREKPRLRFGVMTDSHIGNGWMMGINAPAVEKALRYCREKEVDAVLHCGDVTDLGTIAQLKMFTDIWDRVFPGEKGKGGKHVERIIVAGNHDVRHWTPLAKQGPADIAPQIEKVWAEVLHDKFEPVFSKTVNGFSFIGAHWIPCITDKQVALAIQRAIATTASGDPVFYCQHQPCHNTCYGSWKQDEDGSAGTACEILEKYENSVLITGHSHRPVSHPRSLWQGDYTALNAGVMAWSDFPPFTWPHNLAPATVYAKNICIVSVYTDRMVIERWNVCFDQPAGPDWVIPLPLKKATFPYTLEKETAAAEAPFFPSNARATVNIGMGENVLMLPYLPNGSTCKGQVGGILVSFPAAQTRRAEDLVQFYEITAYRADTGAEVGQKKVYTEFYLGKFRMKNAYDCLFTRKELPKGALYRFRVCAVECMGKEHAHRDRGDSAERIK